MAPISTIEKIGDELENLLKTKGYNFNSERERAMLENPMFPFWRNLILQDKEGKIELHECMHRNKLVISAALINLNKIVNNESYKTIRTYLSQKSIEETKLDKEWPCFIIPMDKPIYHTNEWLSYA